MPDTIFMGTLYGETGPGTSTTTAVAKMLQIPVPDAGMDAGSSGYSQILEFEYGGADVVDSPETHRRYEMSWSGTEAWGQQGVDMIKRLSHKGFGKGMIYFADVYNYDTNLFPPAWAEPGLIEQGWRNIYDNVPTYANTSTNSYNQPIRKATFSVTGAANALPTDKRGICVLPIHPSYTLHMGFSGAQTGTAKLRVRPINLDGSYASTTDLTTLTDTSSTRLNATFSGTTYKAVEVYITRTTTATSTLTITSAMAQLWPTGVTPTYDTLFSAGQGNRGCKFESPALPETYTYVQNERRYHLKGVSATLIEVGTSKRYA